MTDLLPCAFCGAESEYKTEGQGQPPYGLRAWIKCVQCRQSQVCSDWYGGDLGTMEASWNSRRALPEYHEDGRRKGTSKLIIKDGEIVRESIAQPEPAAEVENTLSHISTALHHLQCDGAINRKLICDVLNEALAAIAASAQNHRRCTLVIPDGYKNAEEFAKDCGFKLVQHQAAQPQDVVERVAKAINDADPEAGSYCWSKYKKTHYIPMARAAIAAITEREAIERCPICDWTLAKTAKEGCVPGNCSYRPMHGTPEWHRIQRRIAAMPQT